MNPVKSTYHLYLEDFGDGKNITDVLQLPGGEFHPKVGEYGLALATEVTVHVRLRNGDDVMRLLTVTDALRRYGKDNISVVIPYIPGGRQDRVSNNGEAFTLKVYADLINSQNYSAVYTYDPHSDVTPALINNCKVTGLTNIMRQALTPYDTVIIPDAGAAKKTYSYYLKDLSLLGLDIIQCLKKRDTKTGKLSGFEIVNGNEELLRGHALIIDDICDGGGTFIGLAKQFPYLKKLGLFVTHGIFSKGFKELLDTFDEVMTTNSYRSKKEYETELQTELWPQYIEFEKEEINSNYIDNFKVYCL